MYMSISTLGYSMLKFQNENGNGMNEKMKQKLCMYDGMLYNPEQINIYSNKAVNNLLIIKLRLNPAKQFNLDIPLMIPLILKEQISESLEFLSVIL